MNASTAKPWPLLFAVCGWSGSGKTWLLERLIQHFHSKDLWPGVIKHDAHRLELDRPGKNTARLWEAGVEALLAHDPTQTFLRLRKSSGELDPTFIPWLASRVDFILVEGHKSTPLPKIWLEHPEKKGTPDDLENVLDVLPWTDDRRVDRAAELIEKWLDERFKKIPARVGILTGGKSARMGRPKEALPWREGTLLDHIVRQAQSIDPAPVLLGGCPESRIPSCLRLPDVPGVFGPMAGLLSAARWQPTQPWLFIACDMPLVTAEALQWLVEQRRLGAWALMPETAQSKQPLCAIYEPPVFPLLENAAASGRFSIHSAVAHPKTFNLPVPASLQSAWTACNTPEEWEEVQKQKVK